MKKNRRRRPIIQINNNVNVIPSPYILDLLEKDLIILNKKIGINNKNLNDMILSLLKRIKY